MSRRVGEYEKMEKQLKKALQEAKKGELTVLEQEKELTRMRDDLQKEKDRIRQDVKTTIEQQKRELNGILKVSQVSGQLYRLKLWYAVQFGPDLGSKEHRTASVLDFQNFLT